MRSFSHENDNIYQPETIKTPMLPLLVKSDPWFQRYADRVADLKRLDSKQKAACRRALRSSFQKIYRGVVLDVDGTIIDYTTGVVSPELALIIGNLLQGGVPVILISGRGRTAMREAADSIRRQCRLPLWYLRRLHCVTHNGTHLLYTKTSSPEKFLQQEEVLATFNANKEKLKFTLLGICRKLYRYRPFLSPEPESFRIKLISPRGKQILESQLRRIERKGICVSESQHGAAIVFDITPISKVEALRKVALRMGLHIDDFVRIGDRGAKGGNDYELLSSKHGFSVDRFSNHPKSCFPVINPDSKSVSTGTQATTLLLSYLTILPPLSLSSRRMKKRLDDLRAFEKLAQRRGQEIAIEYSHIVSHRYRALETTGQRLRKDNTWNFNDAFDVHSGAIKIRDWDLPSMAVLSKTWKLFQLTELQRKQPSSGWAMYTDTGIILRGPHYYHSLAYPEKRKIGDYGFYAAKYGGFLRDAKQAVSELENTLMSPIVFKSALAMYDHLRNFVAQSFYVAYVAQGYGRNTHELVAHGYQLLERTIAGFGDALMNPDCTWKHVCATLRVILDDSRTYGRQLSAYIRSMSAADAKQEAFKFRETDYFLQNYAAVEIAVRDLARHGLIEPGPLCAVGLAYGGLDLPALCKYVCQRAGLKCVSSVIKLSMYSGQDQDREKIYRGDQHYLRSVVDKVFTPVFVDGKIEHYLNGRTCILMDDNCTTCATLQLSRDVLFFKQARTVGAVVVRYPGINRFNHMAIKHHGFPEPENLFSFVRGLVAPAPYSRLVNFHAPAKYKDQLGIFDKNKARIETYLKKREAYPSKAPLSRNR